MKHKLAQYKQYKEELSVELRKYVQYKNNPLDERFEVLCECPELAKTSDYTVFNLPRLKDSYYYESIPRYSETNVKDMCERLTKDCWEESDKLTVKEEITFKEYCCDNFISSMTFDW